MGQQQQINCEQFFISYDTNTERSEYLKEVWHVLANVRHI